MWLDLGVDGIRVDAVAHMPLGWQKTFTDTIYHHNPVFIFGEWFTSTEGSDEFHHFANHSSMSVLDFRFAQVVQQVLRNNQGTMYDLSNMLISTEAQYDHAHEQVTFIDNHDINRFTINSQSQDMTHIALALLLTSRGVPTIYYGTEAYLTGEGDPNNRKMLDTFDQTTTAYQVIQKLAPLRKLNNALSYGDTTEGNPNRFSSCPDQLEILLERALTTIIRGGYYNEKIFFVSNYFAHWNATLWLFIFKR